MRECVLDGVAARGRDVGESAVSLRQLDQRVVAGERGVAIVEPEVALVAVQAGDVAAPVAVEPVEPARCGATGAVHADVDVEPAGDRVGTVGPAREQLGRVDQHADLRAPMGLREREQLGESRLRQRVGQQHVDRDRGLVGGRQHQ